MRNIVCTNVKHGEPIRFVKPFTGDKIACTAVQCATNYNIPIDCTVTAAGGANIYFLKGFHKLEDMIAKFNKWRTALKIISIAIDKVDGKFELTMSSMEENEFLEFPKYLSIFFNMYDDNDILYYSFLPRTELIVVNILFIHIQLI